MVCRVTQTIHRACSALALIAAVFSFATPARAVSCGVSQARRLPETHLPDADAAMDARKVDDAIQLYKKALAANPADLAVHAALAEAYLDQKKVAEADAEITETIANHAHSGVLEAVLAEVQLKEGRPWDAQDTIARALADDPCYPDAHLIEGRLLTYISMYGSAAKQYAVAYQLAPHDMDALYRYLPTLPIPERIAALKTFMERERFDPDSQKQLEQSIARLEKIQPAATAPCTLAPSSSTSADIPLLPLMANGQRVRAVGLSVDIEQHPIHLEIDTGAGGLVLSAAAAARAGLHYDSDLEMQGVGNEGPSKGHLAFAKSVKIGSLEFHNCPVEVYEKARSHSGENRPLDESDGLIGMDTLRQFLVTLDYPHGKLNLAPLPQIPSAPAGPLALSSESEAAKSSETDKSLWQDRYIAPDMRDYASAYRIEHFLVVPASIAKDKIRLFVLDTGAYRTIVTTEAGQAVGKLRRDQVDEPIGLSGAVKDLYFVDQVIFNFARVSVVTNQVLAAAPVALGFEDAPMQLSGLIGASALRQCVVHLDYRDGLVKLDYTPGPSRF